mgnify:CR=1 FL=1
MMRSRQNIFLLVLVLTIAFLIVGCGKKAEKTDAATKASGNAVLTTGVPGASAPQTSAGRAIASAKLATAKHDCDGGCGMTAVPLVQLTEVAGKYYCAGCVEHVKSSGK